MISRINERRLLGTNMCCCDNEACVLILVGSVDIEHCGFNGSRLLYLLSLAFAPSLGNIESPIPYICLLYSSKAAGNSLIAPNEKVPKANHQRRHAMFVPNSSTCAVYLHCEKWLAVSPCKSRVGWPISALGGLQNTHRAQI
jgi:hypothetical protein